MPNQAEVIYIFWTCRDKQEAKKLVHGLLDQRLIACASIFPEVQSMYRWEGKIEESQEVKVILKTAAKHFNAVQSYIEQHCSYKIPEIVQVDIVKGNPSYLSWVVQETCDPRPLTQTMLSTKRIDPKGCLKKNKRGENGNRKTE